MDFLRKGSGLMQTKPWDLTSQAIVKWTLARILTREPGYRNRDHDSRIKSVHPFMGCNAKLHGHLQINSCSA